VAAFAAPRPLARRRTGAARWKGRRVMAQNGTVKFFNVEKGYGFIKPDDGGRDIFVHISAVERIGMATLNEGQRITFEIEPDKKGKGPKAVDLKLI
jgi:CspA family cold shock protein